MTDTNPEITLADVTWLTALARSLVDATDADDLVQQTWVAAKNSPPARGSINRAWLARVLKNFHLKSLRSGRRRIRRERLASKSEITPSTAELVERAELRRTLADCLLKLDEPYRRTLMLVAFEGYSTLEIAERDGVSVGVVRHRLRRARELYKAKLERDHGGDWSTWRAALLPYARLPLSTETAAATTAATTPASATIALGAFLLSTKSIVIATALGVSALFWLPSKSDELGSPPLLETTPSTAVRTSVRDRDDASMRRFDTPRNAPKKAPVASRESLVTLTGTVVVRDEFGNLTKAPSGGFHLEEDGSKKTFVRVTRGRWSLQIAPDQTVDLFKSGRFDKRSATILESDEPLGPFGSNAEVALEARFLPSIRIAVLDKKTRKPLTGLTLATANIDRQHPGEFPESRVVTRLANSPVILEPDADSAHYFVRCEGYAWHSFVVDPFAGGEREVLLDVGEARLTVHIAGERPKPGSLYLSFANDIGMGRRFDLGRRTTLTIDHLKPGAYQLRASSGNCRAEATKTVPKGNTDVTLRLAPERKTKLEVAGTVVVPPQWQLDSFQLVFCDSGARRTRIPRAKMKRAASRPGAWRFDAGELARGWYTVSIPETGWQIEHELGRVQANALSFEIPPPGTATLTILDATTGEPLTDKTPGLCVSWVEAGGNTSRDKLATYDPNARRWSLRAPQIKIRINAWSKDYEGSKTFVVGRRPVHQAIRVNRTAKVIFDLFDGEAEVRPGRIFWYAEIKLQAKAGDGKRFSVFKQNDEDVHVLSKSGTYLVTLPPVRGFKPVPNFEIEVEAGKTLRHRVELVRAR